MTPFFILQNYRYTTAKRQRKNGRMHYGRRGANGRTEQGVVHPSVEHPSVFPCSFRVPCPILTGHITVRRPLASAAVTAASKQRERADEQQAHGARLGNII